MGVPARCNTNMGGHGKHGMLSKHTSRRILQTSSNVPMHALKTQLPIETL